MKAIPLDSNATKRHVYLDIARIFAILSITCYHAFSRSFALGVNHLQEYTSHCLLFTVLKSLLYVFCRLGVPMFLAITGALLLNKSMESSRDLSRFYKHNWLSLLITTEIWYVIMYWFVLLSPGNTVLETQGLGVAIVGMIKTMLFIDQTTLSSMWYMPMILCVYTTIPFMNIVKNKLSGMNALKYLLIPLILTYCVSTMLPVINDLRTVNSRVPWSSALSESNLISQYYLYIFIGYFVSKGMLQRFKTRYILLGAGLSLAVCWAYQFYGFSQTNTLYMRYQFPMLPICTGFLLELFRRLPQLPKKCAGVFAYLSKISFAIYFVHILLVTALTWIPAIHLLPVHFKFALLEAVSFGGSILIIVPLSQIPFLRKYLFLIKA